MERYLIPLYLSSRFPLGTLLSAPSMRSIVALRPCFCPHCWAPVSALYKLEYFRIWTIYFSRSQRPELLCLFGLTIKVVNSSDWLVHKPPSPDFVLSCNLEFFTQVNNLLFFPTGRIKIRDLATRLWRLPSVYAGDDVNNTINLLDRFPKFGNFFAVFKMWGRMWFCPFDHSIAFLCWLAPHRC